MTSEDFINSRILRSKEALDEAKLLFDNEHFQTVVNRLYYSIFYLASAFLKTTGDVGKTHSGTKSRFHEVFIKQGIVGQDFGKLYDQLFRERNDTDYGDFQVISKEEAEELLIKTETILKEYWERFEGYRKN